MTYKNKGPPKRSEGVLQTGIRRYDISFSRWSYKAYYFFYAIIELQEIGFCFF